MTFHPRQLVTGRRKSVVPDFVPRCCLDNFSDEERLVLRCHGSRWHLLADADTVPQDTPDRRILDVIECKADPSSEEERVCAKYFGRIDFEEIKGGTPHYELSEEGEKWYPREACRIGIHIPNPKDRMYFNPRKHP